MPTIHRLAVAALCALAGCASTHHQPSTPHVNGPALHAGDADRFIRSAIPGGFNHPERRLWLIAYEQDDASGRPAGWFIEGTIWRIRELPEYTSPILDRLDRGAVWEIDAVALAQNYGVIDMYFYFGGYPRRAETPITPSDPP